MTPDQYISLKQFIVDAGYASEIDWSEDIEKCDHALDFFQEAAWVICNSGMKNQVARRIHVRIINAISRKNPISSVFNHKGKVGAIEHLWKNREKLFKKFLACKSDDEILDFLETLPWIGSITKYHLAKNLGMDACKPDRHLVRIAKQFNTTPAELCRKISDAIGDRVATVDYVIWRAANLGKI